MKNDILEDSPISDEFLTKKQRLAKEKLSKELSKFPTLPNIN